MDKLLRCQTIFYRGLSVLVAVALLASQNQLVTLAAENVEAETAAEGDTNVAESNAEPEQGESAEGNAEAGQNELLEGETEPETDDNRTGGVRRIHRKPRKTARW